MDCDAEQFEEAEQLEEDVEILDNKEVLPHATNTVMFIYLQLIELALECDYTIMSRMVSTNSLLVVKDKLDKLLYEVGIIILDVFFTMLPCVRAY